MEFNGKSLEKYREWCEFVFISILFFVGFFVLYLSNVNLNSLTILQANFVELLVLGVQEHSVSEVLFSTFSGILIGVFSFIIFCFSLSLLSVKKLYKTKYFLIVPIICSGFLFNFSILFLFFALGLFVSSLYVIPLGETYKKELKKWKKFRVGSNAVSKSLFVLFLFIFLGSFISFSLDNSYQQLFLNTTVSSITNIVGAEMSNLNIQTSDSNTTDEYIDQMVEEQMKQVREQYPYLNETQYNEIEKDFRENIEKQLNAENNTQNRNIDGLIEESMKKSVLLNALLVWFPLIMSFTIWVVLEFFRSILFASISGVFSVIWFYVFSQDLEKSEIQNREISQ